MEQNKWEKLNSPLTGLSYNNEILKKDTFFISYNPDTRRSDIGDSIDSLLSMFVGEVGGEETALVDKSGKERKFYILNGDFRKDYEKLVDKGFKKCLDFFMGNKDSWSATTTNYEDLIKKV